MNLPSLLDTFTPPVRAVVFDAVGTLIHPKIPAPITYAAVGLRFGSRYSEGETAARFKAAFARQEAFDRVHQLRTTEEREVRRWRDIVSEVLDDVSDPDACFRELFEHFSKPGAWRCEPETGPLLEELAARGYTLGLASNYDRRLRSVAAGTPALQRIEHLVISSEVGWRKPAGEFFAALCATVGRPTEEILHVGDDLHNDYEGARSAGLRAVLFDPRREGAAPDVLRIRWLAELIARDDERPDLPS